MPTIKTQDIKQGDKFRSNGAGWDALADANKMLPLSLARELSHNEIAVRIAHFPDGGRDIRIFREHDSINVIREDDEKVVEEVVEKTEAEKLYDVGFRAGVNAVLDRLSQEQYTGAVAGQNIRDGLANEIRNYFKEAGKI